MQHTPLFPDHCIGQSSRAKQSSNVPHVRYAHDDAMLSLLLIYEIHNHCTRTCGCTAVEQDMLPAPSGVNQHSDTTSSGSQTQARCRNTFSSAETNVILVRCSRQELCVLLIQKFNAERDTRPRRGRSGATARRLAMRERGS